MYPFAIKSLGLSPRKGDVVIACINKFGDLYNETDYRYDTAPFLAWLRRETEN